MSECDVVLVLDPRQATKKKAPSGMYLSKAEYPAEWTHDENQAIRFTSLEVDSMQESWGYLAGCQRIPTDKILHVGLKA